MKVTGFIPIRSAERCEWCGKETQSLGAVTWMGTGLEIQRVCDPCIEAYRLAEQEALREVLDAATDVTYDEDKGEG